MSRIRVHIDRLVLNGFDPGQRQALAEGLQAELGRVLAGQGGTWRGERIPALRLGRLPLDPGLSGSRSLGMRVASAIGKRLQP